MKKFGPTSDIETSDWKGAVKPLTARSREDETSTGEVENLIVYRKKVKSLMKGIDCYMPPIEALKYGFATGIFISWDEEEKDENSPAFYIADPVQEPPKQENAKPPSSQSSEQAGLPAGLPVGLFGV